MSITVVLAEDDGPLRPLLDDNGSLSHTRGLAAVACCADGTLGVDVERVREVRGMEGIAERLGIKLPKRGGDAARRAAFFAGWTRAEAQGKALRLGLSAPAPARARVWSVPLEGLPDGYAGAVACVEGSREVVVTWLRPSP